METLLIPLWGISLLAGLLVAEKKETRYRGLFFKSALSLLFVVTVFLQTGSYLEYSRYLTWGLILCLGGDVCLALPGEKWFKIGLVVFLLGHILYIIAFLALVPWPNWFSPAGLLVAVASLMIFGWLRPHLGPMKLPVLAYVVVITVMVVGALAVFGGLALMVAGKNMVLSGAVLFYLSDLFVARDRFVRPGFINRLIGLPLYYGGQFLLAFSPGFL